MTDLRDRYRACLLGGAIGDALGGPIEFMSLAQIRARFGPTGATHYVPAGNRSGFITDDTQMTLWTAEGLIRADNYVATRAHGHRPSVIHRAYLRWLHTQRPEGRDDELLTGWLIRQRGLLDVQAPGNTCIGALLSGRMGEIPPAWYPEDSPSFHNLVVDYDTGDLQPQAFDKRSRTPRGDEFINDSKGCGGVMRVAPIGLAAHDPFLLAAEAAALTHGHPSGYLAAGALARIVHDVARDTPLPAAVAAAEAELTRWRDHEEVFAALRAASALAQSQSPPTAEAVESLGAGWVAEEALAIAVYCALTAVDFRSAVALAANHSGDSDSTAAICGNILGAAWGTDALPPDLVAGLELRDLIIRVADDLADHFVDGRSLHDLDRYPAG